MNISYTGFHSANKWKTAQIICLDQVHQFFILMRLSLFAYQTTQLSSWCCYMVTNFLKAEEYLHVIIYIARLFFLVIDQNVFEMIKKI